MKRKNLTAVLLAIAMAAANLTTGTGLVTSANDGGVTFALGDTSGDQMVDAKDASEILAEYSRLSTNKEAYFSGSRAEAADVNKDGRIDSSDASDVLMYYSYVSTGGTADIASYLDTLKHTYGRGTTATSTAETTSADTTTTSAETSTVTSAPATTAPAVSTTETAPATTATAVSTTGTAHETTVSTASATETATTTSATAPAAPDKVSEIQHSNTKCTVEVGEVALSANVTMLPPTAEDKREIWISSDESIATVDGQGWVTGKSEGSCTITVISANNPDVKANIELTVTNTKKVREISLDRNALTLEVGEGALSANVTMLPPTAEDKREIWISSDESIATVDGQGWVTGKSAGSCTITVVSANNPEVKATVEVTVTGGTSTASSTVTTLASSTTSPDSATTAVSTATETATATASETTTQTATTTATATATTTATTTVTTIATTTESATTTVSTTLDASRVSAIELSVTSIELSVGEMGISYVTMLPKTAVNKDEIWSSSDPKVATVDIYGNITAVSEGSCVITVRSADNKNVTADVSVKVFPKDKVRRIDLSATELEIEVGELGISWVTMLPKSAKNKNEIWTCSDVNIATVDQNGWIRGRNAGECIVTVYSAENPEVKADIKVTVIAKAPLYSYIVEEETNSEHTAFCTLFPKKAKGSFTIEYVIMSTNGSVQTIKTSALSVPPLSSYTAYLKGETDDFEVSSYLINNNTGARARIGVYRFFDCGKGCESQIEDINYAFYLVDGLKD